MRKINKITDVDTNMASKINCSKINFIDPKNNNKFLVEGLAFFNIDHEYRRLPLNSIYKVNDAVDYLGRMPSGGQIRFRTNATKIVVKVINSESYFMPHMTKTGQRGVDIYFKDVNNKKYKFYTSSKFSDEKNDEYELVMFESDEAINRDFIINLPLYQALKDIKIGINSGSKLYKPHMHKNSGRILMYGTSITQGGCATRPGMSLTNILSRKMDYEFINLGFSGSGLGEIELAYIINTISNLDMIILDYEANGNKDDLLYTTLEPFIDTLREKNKSIPIIVMSKTPFSMDRVNKNELELRNKFYDYQLEIVKKKNNLGDNKIYFIDGNKAFGNKDTDECTVDGIHPTDLGFYLQASYLKPILTKILKNKI